MTALPSADRRPVSDLPELHGAGLYAFYLNDPEQLAPIETGENGLVYIGMTQDDLHVRNHLLHQISGFSTLRRSFGALLKTRLNLVAIARGRGSSESNFRNYCFTPDGEQRLPRSGRPGHRGALAVQDECADPCLLLGQLDDLGAQPRFAPRRFGLERLSLGSGHNTPPAFCRRRSSPRPRRKRATAPRCRSA